MNLLLYSDPREPITKVLLKHKKALNITPLFLLDFLKKGDIFDTMTDKKVSIRWEMPGLGTITNSKDLFLINRAFSPLQEKWFNDFDINYRLFAQNEYQAYLYFAVNAFPYKTDRPNVGNLVGGQFSLATQWEKVKQKNLPLKTPEYYLGDVQMLPPDWNPADIVCSEDFKFLNWKPNLATNKERYIFAFLKPLGSPYLCLNIHDQVFLYALDPNSLVPLDSLNLKKSKKNKIMAISRDINALFEHFVSEVLVFVNKEDISFGMINNQLLAARKVPDFEQVIVKSFKKHLQQLIPKR